MAWNLGNLSMWRGGSPTFNERTGQQDPLGGPQMGQQTALGGMGGSSPWWQRASSNSAPQAMTPQSQQAQWFDTLYQQDPATAYFATNTAPFGNWFQENQDMVRNQYFGGNDDLYRGWINDSSQLAGNRDAMAQTVMGVTGGGGALQTGGLDPNPALGGGPLEFGIYRPPQTGGTMPRQQTTQGGGGLGAGALGGMQTMPGVSPVGGGGSGIAGQFGPTGGMDLNVNQFLDPSMQFRIDQGINGLESSAAARGGLLSGSTLRGVQDYAQNIASQEYGNAVNRAMADRGFRTGVDQNDRDFAYRAQVGDRDFNFDRDRYNQEFGYRAQVGDRDFNFMRDRDNRNFDYGAQVGDRDFNYRTLDNLARMGLAGAQGGASLQEALARILNGNIMAGGNAGAAGAIGGANAINDTISQILSQLSQNRWYNQFNPFGG